MDQDAQGRLPLNLGVGMVVGLLIGIALSVPFAKWQSKRVKMGWNLVPVLVAADQIDAGNTVTYDVISQRAIPEQFVTHSVVRPEEVNGVVGQRVLVTLEPGDLVMWNQFAGAHGEKSVSLIRASEQQSAGERLNKLRDADMK